MKPTQMYPGTIIELDGELVVKNIEDGEIECYSIRNTKDANVGDSVTFEFWKWNRCDVIIKKQ